MATPTMKSIASALAECAPRYRVNKAYVFGSYARGEADSVSDVDLCIEHDRGFNLFLLGGFGKQLEELLGVSVDVVCGEDSFYPRAKERYLKDRVLVYEKC